MLSIFMLTILVVLNVWVAVRVGDWLCERTSFELGTFLIVLTMAPTIVAIIQILR